MATTISKIALSGSSNGLGVLVVATASTGTTIHTVPSGTTTFDEIWLWAYNGHTANVTLTIQFGGTTTVTNDIKLDIPFKSGAFLVIPGFILQNSLVVAAYAGTTNVIAITGFVNRTTTP